MRIVIGEDEPLLREGLLRVLGQAALEVVGVAGDAVTLVRLALDREPDLVMADIRMPPGHRDDGLRAAIEIRQARPDTGILVLSQHVNRRYALELMAAATDRVGYLLKQRIGEIGTFVNDLHRIVGGGTVLDPEVVTVMLGPAARDGHALARLTPRQLEVLRLVAEGRSNSAIARELVISEKAVVQHVSHIYDQLNLSQTEDNHRRVLAVIEYLSRIE